MSLGERARAVFPVRPLTAIDPPASGTLRKKSLSLGRNLAGSVGGLLPGAVSGMWDPQRDFAFLKVPTSGVKSVVALSGWVQHFSSIGTKSRSS